MTEGTQHRARVTYLLGAGASYGQTKLDENNKEVRASGVPVVNQLFVAVSKLIEKLLKNPDINLYKTPFLEKLEWLAELCGQYPTIDTYARQLFVTKQLKDYHSLKNIITAFLTLEQIIYPHDYRYDGFIASIVKQDKTFPPVNILSWNYDNQFEMAYSGYVEKKDIYNIWKELGAYNKHFGDIKRNYIGINHIKLNGSAHYWEWNSNTDNKLYEFMHISNRNGDTDNLLPLKDLIMQTISCWEKCEANNIINSLSYAWDDIDKNMFSYIQQILLRTHILVVIGYSFPRVNRDIDKLIFQSCGELQRVYIQDPRAREIAENYKSIFLFNNVTPITDTLSFHIPNEL